MTDSPQKKRVRTPRDTQALIVALIQKMISHGHFTCDIKTAIAEKFTISRRSVERYITRARREMQQEVENYLERHRAESFFFYRSIADSPHSADRDRLRARERIDKLLSLDTQAPSENDPADFKLEDLKKMTDEEFDALYQKNLKKAD
ncbi:hypothetical protein Pan241w_23030 [Gimesia alba]|uniref:Uncharacterized protein n=1 Tax=Gimesia alba TaxID=2527973 RepID=A0A517REB7_9PLAN|nr:hypothetical protein [Gimesia alba]QDT42222.1 hypothetical protein Pan241w_23030 [Gimesia alba]